MRERARAIAGRVLDAIDRQDLVALKPECDALALTLALLKAAPKG